MYVWLKEIDKIDKRTVYFKDWTSEKFSKRALEYIITDEPNDDIRLRKAIHVASDILKVLEKHDVYTRDVPYILDRVTYSVQEAQSKSICEKYKIDSIEFLPISKL